MKNENKQIKASKWALGILFVVSAVVLGLFFGVGYGETIYSNSKNLTAPHYTGLLLVWLYALVAICVAAVLVFGLVGAVRNLRYKSKNSKKTGYAAWIFLLTSVLLVASYFLASTKPVLLGDGKTLERTEWVLKLSDTCLYTIYGLMGVALLCTVFSMLGIFKSKR